jgi:hypothetical protein
LISTASAALLLSFFTPWITFFDGNLSGLDIQKNFESYRLVWLMPTLASLTFILSIAGLGTGLMRQLAGLSPFAILAYSLHEIGSELFKSISWGGWLALIAGLALICLPSPPKPQAKG